MTEVENNELYSFLFAVRVSFQDTYQSESDIIRELKIYLLETGTSVSDLDTILHEFYNYYGIDIPIEKIQQVAVTNTNILNNMLGFVLSPGDFDNSVVFNDINNNSNHPNHLNHDNNNNNDSDFDSDDHDSDFDDNEHNQHVHHSNQPLSIMQTMPNVNPINLSTIQLSNNSSTHASMINIINTLMNGLNGINGHPTTNTSTNQQSHTNPQLLISSGAGPMSSFSFGSISGLNLGPVMNLNGFNPINLNNPFQDVVVTVDDKDIDKLKSNKLTTDLDSDCSICMGKMVQNEVVTELNCTHTFHTDCIEPYLKQYNYKCPICRAEVGKAKYNL